MQQDTFYIEQLQHKENDNKFFFYKWQNVGGLKELRVFSELTSKFYRPVAYFRITLKPKS